MQFGRKPEKLEHQIEQLELRLEDLQADEGAAAQSDAKRAQQGRESGGRKPFPDHLEREERLHRPTDEHCPGCGGTHLPDITVVILVHAADCDELLFYVAARGHHGDVGSITPGSMPPDGTVERFGATHTTVVHHNDVFVIETPGGGGYGPAD